MAKRRDPDDLLTVEVFDGVGQVVHVTAATAKRVGNEDKWRIGFSFVCPDEEGFTLAKARISGWVREVWSLMRIDSCRKFESPVVLRKGDSFNLTFDLGEED